MKIKVVYNQDIRRWRISQENTSYEAIVAFVNQCWPNQLPANFGLNFRDDEGDQITVTNDADLQEAIVIARDDCRTSLKLTVSDLDDAPDFIVLGSRESSESDESNVYDMSVEDAVVEAPLKVAEESHTRDVSQLNIDAAEGIIAAVSDEPQADEEAGATRVQADDGDMKEPDNSAPDMADHADMETEQEEPAQPEPESEPTLKQLAQQFFADGEIVAQLDGVIDVVFNALRSGDPIQVALDLVFASFPAIHQHELVQRVLPFIPAFIPKLQSVAPFVLLLGPEVAKQHVKQLAELVQRCLGANDGDQLDITPIMSSCCPNIIKLMQARLPKRPNGAECKRPGCNFVAHPRQGHGYCCWRCKRQGAHGPACQQTPCHEQTVGVEQLLEHFGLAMPDLDPQAAAELETRQNVPGATDDEITHEGVTCDGCGMSPIVGARFKSAVIGDYDLCAGCEASGVEGHPEEFPMIKFGCTMQQIQEKGMRFQGMKEFWMQSKGRGGRCKWGRHGGRGRGGWRRRGRGGCPWRGWMRAAHPEWAVDRMNQQESGEQESARPQATPGHGWGGHPHGWSWGGPYNHGYHGHGHGHHGPRGPPWMKYSQGPPVWPRAPASESSAPQKKAKLKAAFLSDVTIPDRSTHGSQQTLVKTWRMRNTGSMAWEGVYLQFVKGDRSLIAGIDDTSLNGRFPVARVAAGSTADVSATIETPASSGRYCAYFRLHSADGSRFGPQIWVDIKVADESAELQRAIDMSLRPQQVKRAEKTIKKVEKLDGLRRKLHRKKEQLQQRHSAIRQRTDDPNIKPTKLAKLERKQAKIAQKIEKVGARLEDVTMERAERATVVEQLYAPSTNEPTAAPADTRAEEKPQDISAGVQAMSMDEPSQEEATIASADASMEQPTEQPMGAFEYQTEFDQVARMGFDAEPNVIRYLLTEHKGNVGAVVNNLLAAC